MFKAIKVVYKYVEYKDVPAFQANLLVESGECTGEEVVRCISADDPRLGARLLLPFTGISYLSPDGLESFRNRKEGAKYDKNCERSYFLKKTTLFSLSFLKTTEFCIQLTILPVEIPSEMLNKLLVQGSVEQPKQEPVETLPNVLPLSKLYFEEKQLRLWFNEIKERYKDPEFVEKVYNDVFLPFATKDWKGHPTGLLLHGPPGTGKTRFVEEILKLAKKTDKIQVIGRGSASRFFKSEVGKTEEMMRNEANLSHKHPDKLCIMFIDEVETVASDREQATQLYERNFLNQLLAIIGSDTYPNLFLLACTNYRYKLDQAMTRPGRIDQEYFVGPMSYESKIELLGDLPGFTQKLESEIELKGYIETRLINFTKAQLNAVKNSTHNYLLRQKLKTPEAELDLFSVLKLQTEAFLKRNKDPNLLFNRLNQCERIPDRRPFAPYDETVERRLEWQRDFPPWTGSMSGRFIIDFAYQNRSPRSSIPPDVTDPRLLMELCRGYFQNQRSYQEVFCPLNSGGAMSNRTAVLHLLVPIIHFYKLEYVQILNSETCSLEKEEEFGKFFDLKFEECKSLGRSMLVIFVDELTGISYQETHNFSHSQQEGYSETLSSGVNSSQTTGENQSYTKNQNTSTTASHGTNTSNTTGTNKNFSLSNGQSDTQGANWTNSSTQGSSKSTSRANTYTTGSSSTTTNSSSISWQKSVSETSGSSITNSLSQSFTSSDSKSLTLGKGGNSTSKTSSDATTYGKSSAYTSNTSTTTNEGESKTVGTSYAQSYSTSHSVGLTESESTSDSNSQSWGASNSTALTRSVSTSDGESTSNTTGGSFTLARAESSGDSVATGTNTSYSAGTNQSIAYARNTSTTLGYSRGVNLGTIREKNFDTIVRKADNLNFNDPKNGPFLVYVVESEFVKQKLMQLLSWGSSQEPEKTSISFGPPLIFREDLQSLITPMIQRVKTVHLLYEDRPQVGKTPRLEFLGDLPELRTIHCSGLKYMDDKLIAQLAETPVKTRLETLNLKGTPVKQCNLRTFIKLRKVLKEPDAYFTFNSGVFGSSPKQDKLCVVEPCPSCDNSPFGLTRSKKI